MKNPTLWKITCMEKEHPGLWRLWFKHQCVSVGWSVERGFRIKDEKKDHGWSTAKNALQKIKKDDLIIVALPGCRIGRIGKVLEKKFGDEDWNPLIPGDSERKEGYMGRRIYVHWEMEHAPDSPDLVVQLPEGNMGRGTLTRVKKHPIKWFRKVIENRANWVGMVGRFGYEKALSDYIAHFPHRLKDGLEVHPNQQIREKVFDDASRADVLLIERENRKAVIVECKQESPKEEDVKQLRHYQKKYRKETGEQAKGILVHGGAITVDKKVWKLAKSSPQVEIFQYKLDVDFYPSSKAS